VASSKIEEEILICTGVVFWALVLSTEIKLTKDVIICSVKVKLSVFILVTGTAIIVDSRGGHTASFQGAFTVTGNHEVMFQSLSVLVTLITRDAGTTP